GLDCYVAPKDAVSDVIVRFARALQNSLGSNVERMYKLLDGKVEALEFNVKSDCRFLNVPLKNLQLKTNTIIGGIIREKKAISPTGDDVFMAGDRVVVITSADRILRDFSDIIK
ncbi:MAG: Trk system potassium transporter TrkA, partial [Clostridia bacterium]|nr:Trk system potassium transporter TrkA [Clostridia bacterium]